MAVGEVAPWGPSALEAVFAAHHARVFRAAHRITGNVEDAEDVLQTVFLRLARRVADPRTVANPAGYLYRAAVNAALDLLRARHERARVAIDDPLALGLPGDPRERPDGIHEAAEIRQLLRRALARLNPRAAEVFVLRYLEGLDNREIAEVLGTSRVTVAVTLHRARRRLQADLGTTRRDAR
jgi:RNA polymerase sigma-70 factor (ECF subfamily)